MATKQHTGRRRLRRASLALALLTFAGAVTPAAAGQAEMDLLDSYVGQWKGTGQLVGGDQPETFNCRLTVAKGEQTKINYAGRCAVAGLNLSVAGTIAYNPAAGRYEAAMTSNTRFSGMVAGTRHNNSIVFDLSQRRAKNPEDDLSVGSQIILKDNRITVNFELTFVGADKTMKTSVPFQRS